MMGPKTFQKMVDRVFPIRKKYSGIKAQRWDPDAGYPDYGGIPASLFSVLSPTAIDAMRSVLKDSFVRKRDFAKAYKTRLKELGEPGNYA